VVLEKGVAGPELISWYKMVSDAASGFSGKPHGQMTSTVEIKLSDREGGSSTTFTLQNAWPCKVTYDDLDATSSDVLVHRLEICHEGIAFN
jgi:phage tail-like protein